MKLHHVNIIILEYLYTRINVKGRRGYLCKNVTVYKKLQTQEMECFRTTVAHRSLLETTVEPRRRIRISMVHKV